MDTKTIAPAAHQALWEQQWMRPIVRTAIQLVAGGLLTELFNHITGTIPAWFVPYVTLLSTLVVSAAQNWCEKKGIIPILLPRTTPATTAAVTTKPTS